MTTKPPADPLAPLSLEGVRTYSLYERSSKVDHTRFAQAWEPGGTFRDFCHRLPRLLAGEWLREVAHAWVSARRRGHLVVLGMGAHVLKVGLTPVLLALCRRGLLSALAVNGACLIHDAEIALAGRTSEDVDQALGGGEFGMARETAEFLNRAISEGVAAGLGLGVAVGRALATGEAPYRHLSLLAGAWELGLPVTVHVALGTDIIHIHPSCDPGATGVGTHRDFRLFAALVSRLAGGMYLNVGSAVLLPEVFLKAVTLARNLGHPVAPLTTVNLDFIQHYRPQTNVVRRPTAPGGRGWALTGHHELLVPLLAALVLELWEEEAHAD
ncbi:MAG: hypothetical protein K6T55_06315 [Syntrophobacterales bacterium]|nr:hypothetical protein [Syntrophobacterales bacterium]